KAQGSGAEPRSFKHDRARGTAQAAAHALRRRTSGYGTGAGFSIRDLCAGGTGPEHDAHEAPAPRERVGPVGRSRGIVKARGYRPGKAMAVEGENLGQKAPGETHGKGSSNADANAEHRRASA